MLLIAALVSLLFLPSPWGYVAVALALVVEIGELYFWIHFLRRYRITTGSEGLIGERAEVTAHCDPVGRVRLRGEHWRARSAVPLEPGDRVQVAAVKGLTLTVEPAGEGNGKGPR